MSMLRVVIAAVLFVTACDAERESGTDAATSGPACTNSDYDPCTSNDQCSSNICHLFPQAGLRVCATPCTVGDDSTCPFDKTGAHGQCNMMGICKPAVANNCTR